MAVKWNVRTTAMTSMSDSGQIGLVASGGGEFPVNPPDEWFAQQQYERPQPVFVEESGHIHGHVAKWGSIHIGYLNRDIPVPRSKTKYQYFMNKNTVTASGTRLATGVIVMDTVHPKLKGMAANEASSFYDNTGCAFADVKVYEDEFGIQITGAVRPSVSALQLRAINGSDFSPDWRGVDGNLEMVALLACCLSGFLVEANYALVASAGMVGIAEDDALLPGEATALETDDALDALFGVNDSAKVETGDAATIAYLQEKVSKLEAVVDSLTTWKHVLERAEAVKTRLKDYSI